jgi:anti-anti-sigma regulatory factor
MSDAAITVIKPLVAGAVLLRFSCRRFNTVGTVLTAVEQDIAAVPELDLTLRRAQPDARVVVLDLCELKFIDWSGAHVLFAAECRARGAGGRLLVGRDAAQIDRLFVLSGVDRQLELVEQPPAVAASAAMEHAR